MFTGLVSLTGKIINILPFGNGRRFAIDIRSLAETAKIGQSIAVNGVCLTVTALSATIASFDAMTETIQKTNLGNLRQGDFVNLEPALLVGDPLDGHIVLGHIDCAAPILNVTKDRQDNRIVTITLPQVINHLVAPKGSIAIDGISLTVISAEQTCFTVGIIPHTWENTTLQYRSNGETVNIEADVLARYTARILQFSQQSRSNGLTMETLIENGYAR